MNKAWAVVALLAAQGAAFQSPATPALHGRSPLAARPTAARALAGGRPTRTSVLRRGTDGYLTTGEVPGFMANPTLAAELAGLGSPYGISEDPRDTVLRATKKKETMTRILLPTAVAFVLSTVLYPYLSLLIKGCLDAGELSIIGNDSSQFIQNFVTVNGLTLSIFCGNSFYFLYQQTESIYNALYAEVSEAKTLLEQTSLVCGGRPFYKDVLNAIQRYIQNDLKRLDYAPATLLSSKPKDDPLETILYLTSVGVPSVVYDTVRSLRACRGQRLGALQRKLPEIHFVLLYFLTFIELLSFPLLGAGTASFFTDSILTVQGVLFGAIAGSLTMTLCTIRELWNPVGGAYNVDAVLQVMVRGLEDECAARLAGASFAASASGPSPPRSLDTSGNPSGVSGTYSTPDPAATLAARAAAQTAIDEAVRVALAEQAAQAAARNPKRKGIRGVASRLFDKVF